MIYNELLWTGRLQRNKNLLSSSNLFLLPFLMKKKQIVFNNGNTLKVNSINFLGCHNAHTHPVIL